MPHHSTIASVRSFACRIVLRSVCRHCVPIIVLVLCLDRGDAVYATVGEEYDDDGRPTGGLSGMIEYEPSERGTGSYSIAGRGDSAEAAVTDIEDSLLRAMSLNADGRYVTSEILNAAGSESGFEFV